MGTKQGKTKTDGLLSQGGQIGRNQETSISAIPNNLQLLQEAKILSTEDGNEHEANTNLEKGGEQERSKDFPFGSFIASKGKVEK